MADDCDLLNLLITDDLSIDDCCLLFEGISQERVQALSVKYNLSPENILTVNKADPHFSGGYTDWILNQIRKRNLRFDPTLNEFEDSETTREILDIFMNLSRKESYKGSRDIGTYESFSDLARELDKYREEREEVTLGGLFTEDDIIVRKPPYTVVRLSRYDQSKAVSEKTSWCIKDEGWFKDYVEDGPLYCILKSGVPYVLLHFETGQIKDVYDEAISTEIANEIRPVMIELESIVGRKTRQGYFVSLLTREEAVSDPRLAYLYAKNAIKGRFPEGEKAIASDPEWSHRYAANVIGGRFPKGEKAIASDPWWACRYAEYVIKGRWPKGEKAIASDPKWSREYAQNVVRGKFP